MITNDAKRKWQRSIMTRVAQITAKQKNLTYLKPQINKPFTLPCTTITQIKPPFTTQIGYICRLLFRTPNQPKVGHYNVTERAKLWLISWLADMIMWWFDDVVISWCDNDKISENLLNQCHQCSKKKFHNETLEFKSNFNNELIETLVAFANTSGGKVITGITPRDGVAINAESVQNWLNEIKNKTSPPLIPD